jgi:hypothetical protein
MPCPARREKAVPFPITDSPITPFPITDSPITEPPNMIDDIPLRPQNIIKIEKKRLEELSREEMKVLVDYLYDSDYNEIDHR